LEKKTQQVAHTLEEKIGYPFTTTTEPRDEFKYVDPLASPKELLLVKSQLKKTQTIDKSKPVIEKGVHILKNHHMAVFAEIKQHRELKHTEIQHDASAPFITKDMRIKESPQKKIFEEIRQPRELKHVKTNDRSAPVIPRDAHIGVPKTETLLGAGKSALSTAKQVAQSIGEKTQQAALHPVDTAKQVAQAAFHPVDTAKQVAYSIGEKTQQVAEKIGLSATDRKDSNSLVNVKDLLAAKSKLKHTQTQDKSRPLIDKDIHIMKNNHKALFAEIQQHRELKHVEIARDASFPIIGKDVQLKRNRHRELFAEIKQLRPLHHVSITHDASAPFIDRSVHIKEAPQRKVLEAGKVALSTAKQVAQTIGERTQQAALAPIDTAKQVANTIGEKIEEKTGYKLTAPEPKTDEFVKFVDPLASPRDLKDAKSHLKHIETEDKSKPVIDKSVHIKENHHKELLSEIAQKHDLNHVVPSHDASKPLIDKDIHIKEAPQKRILSDITQHHQLKHVSMNDKSAPVIPKDVHIVKRKKILE
jgi:flavodoxin